ncbi:MAG: TetR/AcrR family transcriptional regulator [Solirubrobacterales bacterium]
MSRSKSSPAPAKRRTRAQKRAETREALLEAAWTVFLRRGFAGSSVEEISEEAGYSRGAFYYNYDSVGELFAELLQERVYEVYREMGERRDGERSELPSLREAGEELAAMQAQPGSERLLRLWLELLAEAGRDEDLRKLAAGFWSGNRGLLAELIRRDYAARDDPPPADPGQLASAVIALDIGLAIQHYVDPDAVGLDIYPDLLEALFGE